MSNYVAIEIKCHACKAGEQFSASGESLADCPKCSGTGYLSWGRIDVTDLVTKLDALDTQHDALEAKIDALEPG